MGTNSAGMLDSTGITRQVKRLCARLVCEVLVCLISFYETTALRATFDRTIARAGNRQDWMRVMTLGLVVTGSFLLQGCFAGAGWRWWQWIQ